MYTEKNLISIYNIIVNYKSFRSVANLFEIFNQLTL